MHRVKHAARRGDGGEASGLKGSYGFVHSWRGSVLQICHQVAGACDVVRWWFAVGQNKMERVQIIVEYQNELSSGIVMLRAFGDGTRDAVQTGPGFVFKRSSNVFCDGCTSGLVDDHELRMRAGVRGGGKRTSRATPAVSGRTVVYP
jgi:hypothetical protein